MVEAWERVDLYSSLEQNGGVSCEALFVENVGHIHQSRIAVLFGGEKIRAARTLDSLVRIALLMINLWIVTYDS